MRLDHEASTVKPKASIANLTRLGNQAFDQGAADPLTTESRAYTYPLDLAGLLANLPHAGQASGLVVRNCQQEATVRRHE